ncbi:MAG: energy transducer TonB [Chitinophagaceae bacterium]
MEANKILGADILDIVFDGRNKNYGAYELRKKYNKRLTIALIITASLAALILLLTIISSLNKDEKVEEVEIAEVELTEVKEQPKEEPPPPPPPPPPQAEPPKVEMKQFTPPVVVKDEEVREDEKPPKVEELADTKISTINQEGIKDEGIVAPPAGDGGKGVVVGPTKVEDDLDKVFQKVEIESKYPGGPSAWARYLNRFLRYPDRAVEDGIQGTVVIQFIVDREGKVSEVTALNDPGGGLAEEAIRIIKKSGTWEPAIQNGRKVKSYKKQPITFKLEEG